MTTPYVRQGLDVHPGTRGRKSAAAKREELSEAYRQLERSALHDGLTGLANRSQLVVRLAALDATRLLTSALVFVDLDDFKDVNDTHGDAESDELLRTAAARMRSCIRPGDLLARLGGDEFAVLMEGADVDAAEDLARRAVEAMNVPFSVGGQLCHVTASVGVAVGTVDVVNPQVLLRSADLAMYEAKSRGKSRFVRFDVAMSDALTLRTRTEGELRHAIEQDELVLHYQPIMDVSSGDMAGVEALVRWQHPVRGLLGPDEFVPLAERTGAIVALGAWVLGTACRQGAAWQAARERQKPLVVSVNVSARQLDEPTFVVTVSQILADTGLDPASLCLEVTETAVMSNPAGVQQAGQALRDLGVRLSIDDFGTGYASLAYLRRLHASELKIDRSFVDGLGHELDDTTIVTAVIGLAHAMGLSVTAEGVETTEQLGILRDMGCQKAQGIPDVPAGAGRPPDRRNHGSCSPAVRPRRPRAGGLTLHETGSSRGTSTEGSPRSSPVNGATGPSPDTASRSTSPTVAGAGSRGTLLIVDDNAINQQVAGGFAAKHGYRSDVAGNGIEALAALEGRSYEAVLMDCLMPELDGFEATAEIRRREAGRTRVPIIAMTAGALADDREKCLAAGMDDYLTKPVKAQQMEAVLRRWTERGRRGAGPDRR